MKPSQPEFMAYRASISDLTFEVKICTQFTDHTVMYKKRKWDGKLEDAREKVRSWGCRWFRTRPEAVAYLREQARFMIENANRKIDFATAAIERLRGEPE